MKSWKRCKRCSLDTTNRIVGVKLNAVFCSVFLYLALGPFLQPLACCEAQIDPVLRNLLVVGAHSFPDATTVSIEALLQKAVVNREVRCRYVYLNGRLIVHCDDCALITGEGLIAVLPIG